MTKRPDPRLRRPPSPPRRRPRSAEEQAAIDAIMRHPSYLEADHDVDFLARYDTRGVRLQA